jgi:hypothetical protein
MQVDLLAEIGMWIRRVGLGKKRWIFAWAILAVMVCAGCCSTSQTKVPGERPFVFRQDSFSFSNELVWVYRFNPVTGKYTHEDREPPPTYSHHCFVVARSAKQFFKHARFDPSQPPVGAESYRKLIRKVVKTGPNQDLAEKVIIPGYSNLFTFSKAQEALLKEECGGAWRSYFQRGHWRIMLPFSRGQQAKMAKQLAEAIRRNDPPVVHLVQFPELTINHAVLLFDLKETEQEIQFVAYDPNMADGTRVLTFDRQKKTFRFPSNDYFVGGDINVYEIYHRWNY